MIKLSVNETKWSSLLARIGALILYTVYISIWIFDFGPEKLPELSRNGPMPRSMFVQFEGLVEINVPPLVAATLKAIKLSFDTFNWNQPNIMFGYCRTSPRSLMRSLENRTAIYLDNNIIIFAPVQGINKKSPTCTFWSENDKEIQLEIECFLMALSAILFLCVPEVWWSLSVPVTSKRGKKTKQ